MPEVLKGIEESFKSGSPESDAKNIGRQLGSQLKNQILPYMNSNIYPAGNDSLNADIFFAAFMARPERLVESVRMYVMRPCSYSF